MQCQGGIPAGGDFRLLFGRKYNRLPLVTAPQIILMPQKGSLASLSWLPPRTGLGSAQDLSLGVSMPERRRCPSRRAVSKSGVTVVNKVKPRKKAEANVKDFLRHFQKWLTLISA